MHARRIVIGAAGQSEGRNPTSTVYTIYINITDRTSRTGSMGRTGRTSRIVIIKYTVGGHRSRSQEAIVPRRRQDIQHYAGEGAAGGCAAVEARPADRNI